MALIFLALLVILILYVFDFYRTVKLYPKGPMPLPFLGNLHQVDFSRIDGWFTEQAKKYGPIYTVYLPRPNVIITKYEYIREALLDFGDAFTGRRIFFPVTLLRTTPNGGVVFSDGENWRQQRRCSLKILRDFGMGKNLMENQVMESVREFLHQLSMLKDKDNVDFHWPIQVYFNKWSSEYRKLCVANVIYETLFGYHFEYDDCERLKRFVNYFDHDLVVLSNQILARLSHIFPFLLQTPFLRKFCIGKGEEAAAKIVGHIIEEVNIQKAKYDPAAAPETFVQAYFKAMEAHNPYLTYAQLVNVVTDLWVAGLETTTSTLRWAVLLLQRNPEVQSKMRQEIFDVVGRTRDVKMIDKSNMPYCYAGVMEIQRQANTVAFNLGHVTLVDSTIGGFKIPKGTEVTPQIADVLSDPIVYKNPEQFEPSRFLCDDGKTFKKEAVEHLIPFGLGKRQCLGESLARMQLFLVLTNLLQKFQLDASPSQSITYKHGTVGPFNHLGPYFVKVTPL